METPNLDAAIREINMLRESQSRMSRELKQKQESWDKAANYRDEVLKLREWKTRAEMANEELSQERYKLLDRVTELVEQCNARSDRIAALCAENDKLRSDLFSARQACAGLGDDAVGRCASLRKEIAVLEKWKAEQMEMNRRWNSVDEYIRKHPEVMVGDSICQIVGKWLVERDYLKRKFAEISNLLPRP